MSDYISWSELKTRWDKLDFQLLVDYLPKMPQPYSQHGNPIPCPTKYHEYYNIQFKLSSINIEISKRKNDPDYDVVVSRILPPCPTDFPKKSNEDKLRALENEKVNLERELAEIEKEDPKCEAWKNFINPESDEEIEKIIAELRNAIFKREDVVEFEATHNIRPVQAEEFVKKPVKSDCPPLTDRAVKGMRHSRKIKNKCREIAAKIWKKEKITIAEMCRRPEIKDIAINKNGKPYKEKTIRNWIKDLAPDNSPGRPPK